MSLTIIATILSVKILINQLLDEGHCAGNEEVCGASHYRYGTNENWIYK